MIEHADPQGFPCLVVCWFKDHVALLSGQATRFAIVPPTYRYSSTRPDGGDIQADEVSLGTKAEVRFQPLTVWQETGNSLILAPTPDLSLTQRLAVAVLLGDTATALVLADVVAEAHVRTGGTKTLDDLIVEAEARGAARVIGKITSAQPFSLGTIAADDTGPIPLYDDSSPYHSGRDRGEG